MMISQKVIPPPHTSYIYSFIILIVPKISFFPFFFIVYLTSWIEHTRSKDLKLLKMVETLVERDYKVFMDITSCYVVGSGSDGGIHIIYTRPEFTKMFLYKKHEIFDKHIRYLFVVCFYFRLFFLLFKWLSVY